MRASRVAENPVARGDTVRVIQRNDENGPLSPKNWGNTFVIRYRLDNVRR